MPPITQGTAGLNNVLQRLGKLTSLSWIETPSGVAHAPTWTVICKLDGVERGRGSGLQKHVARDQAANMAITYLNSLETQ